MKQYGANKATEFTRKQINVIFALTKQGTLAVEKKVMSSFYDLAEYYGYDDNKSVEQKEGWILGILENVFANKYDEAQNEIDSYARLFCR